MVQHHLQQLDQMEKLLSFHLDLPRPALRRQIASKNKGGDGFDEAKYRIASLEMSDMIEKKLGYLLQSR